MGGFGKKRTEAERFSLMEKAIAMSTDGHDYDVIAKSLKVGRSSLDRWKATKDWDDIASDIAGARRRAALATWRGELGTAVKIAKRIAAEGDPNNAVMLDTMKFIIESLDMGPKGEDNGNTQISTAPVAIQIITGDERAALTADLRHTLGEGDNSVDTPEE